MSSEHCRKIWKCVEGKKITHTARIYKHSEFLSALSGLNICKPVCMHSLQNKNTILSALNAEALFFFLLHPRGLEHCLAVFQVLKTICFYRQGITLYTLSIS